MAIVDRHLHVVQDTIPLAHGARLPLHFRLVLLVEAVMLLFLRIQTNIMPLAATQLWLKSSL